MKDLIKELIEAIQKEDRPGHDVADLGNAIGIIISNKLPQEDQYSFLVGIEHGFSLGNNTHP